MTVDSDSNHKIKSCLLLGIKAMTNLDNVLNSRDITLPKKVHIVRAMVFPVVMYECESWIIKKAECQRISALQIMVLKKTLESPLDYKETKPVNPKGDQPWILVGRTDAKAPIFWSRDARSQLIGKDPDAEKDLRQKEKGEGKDEMVG